MSKNKGEPKEVLGLNRITKKRILELCKKDKLYQTPELNDVLYLHYQGFQSIECLEDYSELKCLWLECNAISEIQGLDNQTKLKCLFLQSNLIKKIENLECCKELDTINLSQNHIRKIENCGFEVLPALNTLNISSNYLKDCEGLKELEYCKNLSVLDLSNNRIDDILVVKIFAKMPELKVLVLQGNPVVSKIPQYRKTLILECKKLTYLDSRPVFPKDRSCAEAWKRGGYEEERKENERWNRLERRKMRDSVNATIRMRNKNRKPEDQLTLLVSSDSEDELDAKKLESQHKLAADVGMDSMWDEVANDSTLETTSSDITVSSSNSANTSDYSNEPDLDGKDAKANECLKTFGKENIIFDSNDESIKVCNSDSDTKIVEKNDEENDVEMDSMWDETAYDSTLETTSSDITVSSSNSVNTSDYSKKTDSDKKDVTVNESLKTSDEENICNDSNDESNKVCSLDSDKNIVKPNYTENTVKEGSQKFEVILRKNSEDKFDLGEQHTNEDHDLKFKNNTDAVDSIDAICQASFNNSSQIENTLEKPLKRVQLQIKTLNGNEEENYEPLKELEEAMNSLIKKIDIGEEKSLKLNSDQKNISSDITSTETQYEQECSAVNHQLKTDFEQLSVNMDNFITQLNKEKEERKEAIEAFFDKKEISKEKISDSSDNETYDNLKELDQWDTETRLKSCKRRYVEEQDEKREIPKIWINDKPSEEKEELVKKHKINEIKIRKNSEDNKELNSPQQENIKIQAELEEELKFNGSENLPNSIAQKSETSHSFYSRQEFQQYVSNIDSYLKSTNKSNESATKVGSSDQEPPSSQSTHKENDKQNLNLNRGANVSAMDSKLLSRNTNDAWNSFEKEAKKLKDLLQKLENKNEDLFKELDTDSKNQDELPQKNLKIDLHEQSLGENLAEESIQKINENQTKKNIEKDIEMPTQNVDKEQSDQTFKQIPKVQNQKEKICVKELNENLNSTESSVIQQLLEEIIQSLKLKPLKPKSYEFVIDSEEEFTYSATKSQENSMTSNTIPDFVEPFKEFLKNIAIKNCEDLEKASLERPIFPYQESKQFPTTDEKKSVCLHELSKQENLKDFNNDTHESLDQKLREFKDKQTKNIRRMVDRVYSQKERYNDSLEVVDGKLVVRDKDTGEVKELPQPAGNLSDSDIDYDTAQSEEEEEEGAWCIKPPQKKSFFNLKSHYNKIHSLGEENDLNDSDESNDEFFSLDPQAKPNLYKNIDDEFLNKLTLEHLTLTDEDEHHIIQCASSYEELKTCLKLRKEDRCLTEIENELLEKITESKLANNQENLSQIMSNNDGITKEENLLLKRMKKITKDKEHSNNGSNESNEKQFNQEIDRIPLQKSKETVKIFEYENYNESSPLKEQRETSSDLDKSLEFFDDYPSEFSENNVYTFVYEDSEKNNEIKEEKIQPYKEIEYVENEEELNRQDFFEDLLQREVSFHKVQTEIQNLNTTDLHLTTSAYSLASLEKYSEEEKNEIESNIDVEGTEMNQKLEYVQEKECLEEKECVETSENTGNDNFEVSVVQEFSDFKNPPNIQHTSVNESLQHKLTPSNIEKQHLDDKTHKSNETLQSTSSTKFENRKELVSQENSFNSANSTPDIPPYSEANFRQYTNELPTHNYTEELSSLDYVADFEDSKEDIQSTNTSDVDILECNLEIFGGNNEIIDTITVNAQVQYDY